MVEKGRWWKGCACLQRIEAVVRRQRGKCDIIGELADGTWPGGSRQNHVEAEEEVERSVAVKSQWDAHTEHSPTYHGYGGGDKSRDLGISTNE